MKRMEKLKKGIALVLSTALVLGLNPIMPGNLNEVQAAESTISSPSITAYATKADLMTKFGPDE